tara:strand:- start:1006 stop:1821 length:816 start_codon:yes stop_codon:yes gene_type:complete
MKKNKYFNVNDKVIVLIGSTGILGEQYANYLSKKGAIVIIGDYDISKCKKLSSNINKKHNSKSLPLEVNIYSKKSIKKFYNNIIEITKKIDVVINNFQVKPDGFYDDFINYSKKTLMKVIEGNTVGTVLSSQCACKLFLKQGYGNIINISSIYGLVAADQRVYSESFNPYNNKIKLSSPVSYGVSKSSIINFTKYLASYYREKNIRVNCLTPGGVYDNHNANFVNSYSAKTLLGRMAKKDEYNAAILFLSSDASSYMSGSNLIIDGGWSAI